MRNNYFLVFGFFYFFFFIVNSNTNVTQTTSPFITINNIQKDIDTFLRLGYKQLASATLANIKSNNANNNILAYLVNNGSVFVFDTDYVVQNHSIKILGVLELTGLQNQIASGMTIQKRNTNTQSVINNDRRVVTNIPPKQVLMNQSQLPAKRTFLQELGNYDFSSKTGSLTQGKRV